MYSELPPTAFGEKVTAIMIKTTTRFAALALALVLVPAAAFAQQAPVRTCNGTFAALRSSMGDTPRCLTAPEADQLQRLCAPGSLRVDSEYMSFVRATPSCQAIDLNVLAYRPAPTPLCEMGSQPVTRGGVTTACTCPAGTMLVHAGRHYGCATGTGYVIDLTLQTLAHGATDEQCEHAGVTPEECAGLRRTASNVTPANVDQFNARFTTIETRLTNVEGVASVANGNALTALAAARRAQATADLALATSNLGTNDAADAHARANSAHALASGLVGTHVQHGVGVGVLALATDGSAHPYALGTIAWQMRVPFTAARRGFFVLDAQAGMGGSERFGFVFGGSLAATFEHSPANWFSFGIGPVATAMGILWRDSRFPDGNNAAWAVGVRMPIRFQPTPSIIVSLYGDLTFGRATTVVDVTTPAQGNDPASTREVVTRTPTSASGGGGATIQYLF